MKRKKLLRKIKALLSADERKQAAKYESLDKVLRKLIKKEAALQARLDAETDDESRQKLQHKLDVLRAQREKGEELKRKLDRDRDA